MAVHLEQRLLTVEEYHKMAEAGILGENDKVELLNGQLIKMSPIGSKHAALVEKTRDLLREVLGNKAMVRARNPVILGDLSEPEPDIAIVGYKENYYADRHPKQEEIFLVIEVADSSLEKDRQAKLPIYAAAGIPEYWIVNLENRSLEVHRSPAAHTYQSKLILFPGESLKW